MTKENLVKAPVSRVRRGPLEGRNKLRVKGKDPAYEYRIVNDTDDRVHDFLDRGWELDTDESIRVGDSSVDKHSKLGSVRQISVGENTKAVLMRIRKEWKEEDDKAKLDYVKATELAMKPNPNDGTYGKVEITRR